MVPYISTCSWKLDDFHSHAHRLFVCAIYSTFVAFINQISQWCKISFEGEFLFSFTCVFTYYLILWEAPYTNPYNLYHIFADGVTEEINMETYFSVFEEAKNRNEKLLL